MSSSNDASLQRSLERLFQRAAHGIQPGLEVIQAVLKQLEDPQRAFLSIHVAGTNGKGSVCAMVESMLRAAGFKTGLYTSPHLIDFHERIRVSGRCLSDAELVDLIEATARVADDLTHTGGLRRATFFELTTAMAYEHFRRKGVEIAVIETGMGGLWDATNVLDPLISVITGIHLDHTDYLGTDIAAIAREKAGIIKHGRPVVCGALSDAAAPVVRAAAREREAPLLQVRDSISVSRVNQDWDGQKVRVEGASASYGTLPLPLVGDHQLENCALAVGVIETLGSVYSLDIGARAIRDGLASCRWPARGQVLRRDPLVILDAAHNPDGAAALARLLRTLSADARTGLILGFLADKDVSGYMKEMAGAHTRCWVVPIENERSMPVEDVASACRAAGMEPECGDVDRVWEDALHWARREGGMICVSGSIYLAGAVLKREWGEGGLCRWLEGAP